MKLEKNWGNRKKFMKLKKKRTVGYIFLLMVLNFASNILREHHIWIFSTESQLTYSQEVLASPFVICVCVDLRLAKLRLFCGYSVKGAFTKCLLGSTCHCGKKTRKSWRSNKDKNTVLFNRFRIREVNVHCQEFFNLSIWSSNSSDSYSCLV